MYDPDGTRVEVMNFRDGSRAARRLRRMIQRSNWCGEVAGGFYLPWVDERMGGGTLESGGK